jgi:hypothetical protein
MRDRWLKKHMDNKWITLKKISFKILIDTIDLKKKPGYRQFHKWHVAKICGWHRGTLQNYKATWLSLSTNEKAKSISTSLPESPSKVSPVNSQIKFRRISENVIKKKLIITVLEFEKKLCSIVRLIWVERFYLDR